MNVRILENDITNESVVVQWDAVDDIFPVTYNVTWYNESGIIGMDTVNGTSYNVTGLTANTSYNITVVAINTCGAGPVSNVIMTMTNIRPPTLPPTTIPTLSFTPTTGNILLSSSIAMGNLSKCCIAMYTYLKFYYIKTSHLLSTLYLTIMYD